jgi:hypothetical protein
MASLPDDSAVRDDLQGKQKRPVGNLLRRKPEIDAAKRCKAPADPLQARVGCSIAPPLPASQRPAMFNGHISDFGCRHNPSTGAIMLDRFTQRRT